MLRALFTIVLLLAITATALAGPLTPPGVPAPTMKTLDQVEPSTPINATNTPGDATATYVISQPGAYHLTGNLLGEAGKDGIRIDEDDVTIDLRGFSLLGQGVGQAGIRGNAGATVSSSRARVSNGIIRDWLADGIDFSITFQAIIDRITVRNVGGDGIHTIDFSIVRNCTVDQAGGNGIQSGLNSLIVECTSAFNAGRGFSASGSTIVRDSTARDNQQESFWGGEFYSCYALGGTAGFRAGSIAVNCAVAGADVGFDGIDRIESSTALGCDVGFDIPEGGVLTDSKFERGSLGVFTGVIAADNTKIRGCSIVNTGGGSMVNAIFAGNNVTIEDCSVESTATVAILVQDNAIIRNTMISAGAANGIFGGANIAIDECVIDATTAEGLVVGANARVRNTTIRNAGGTALITGTNGLVENCTIAGSGNIGVSVGQRSIVRGCNVSGTTNSGVVAVLGTVIEGNMLGNIGFIGISAGESAQVRNNTINNASRHGVTVTNRSTVVGNTIDFTGFGAGVNDGAGILCTSDDNRVDGNSVTRADYGVRTLVGGNLIINNSVSGMSVGFYATTAGDAVGAIVNAGSIGASSAAHANIVH